MTVNRWCGEDPGGMGTGSKANVPWRYEVGSYQPMCSVTFFPGKWHSYHQKAPKLSKTLASLGLTSKTAHWFRYCSPLSTVLVIVDTQLQRYLVPFTIIWQFPWFLGFFWGSSNSWGCLNLLSSCSLLFCFLSSKSWLGRWGLLRPGGFPQVWIVLEGGNFPNAGWVSTFPCLTEENQGHICSLLQRHTPFPAGWSHGREILSRTTEQAGLEICCRCAWTWHFHPNDNFCRSSFTPSTLLLQPEKGL